MNEKLTADVLAKMKPGGRPKTFRCDTAAQLESARQNAYWIKRNKPRPDGAVYHISYSIKAMVITISVIPKTEES
jgi:hypothetical protein